MVTVIDIDDAQGDWRRYRPASNPKAWRSARTARPDRQHVRNHQHGAFHRLPRRARSWPTCWSMPRPRFAAFKHDGSEVWVSSELGGTVSVIDPVKHVVTSTRSRSTSRACAAEAIQPVGIDITSDDEDGVRRARAGQPRRGGRCRKTIQGRRKYLLVGQRVWHMAFTPDEKYLLTTNGLSNDVSVIDVAALKVVKTIQVGELPWGVVDIAAMSTTRDAPYTVPAAPDAPSVVPALARRRASATAMARARHLTTSASPSRRRASPRCSASTAPARPRCSR